MPKIVCNIIEVCVFKFENTEPLYLMLRRSQNETLYPDAWQIVTGSIESGETAVQGALRELKEETGFIPVKFWVVPHVNTFYSAQNDAVNHTVVFAAQVGPALDVVLSQEHSHYGWYTIEKAKATCVWPGQVNALDVVHEYIVRGKEASSLSEITL
jgi:dATP pyrophosphohydrolase